MIRYSYDFRQLRPTALEKSTLRSRAITLVRAAAAVDTGEYRRSWQVRWQRDLLIAESTLRYAGFVENGSSVHRKHRHKIRRALQGLGLTRPSIQSFDVSTGQATTTGPQSVLRELADFDPVELTQRATSLNRVPQASIPLPLPHNSLITDAILLATAATLLHSDEENTQVQ